MIKFVHKLLVLIFVGCISKAYSNTDETCIFTNCACLRLNPQSGDKKLQFLEVKCQTKLLQPNYDTFGKAQQIEIKRFILDGVNVPSSARNLFFTKFRIGQLIVKNVEIKSISRRFFNNATVESLLISDSVMNNFLEGSLVPLESSLVNLEIRNSKINTRKLKFELKKLMVLSTLILDNCEDQNLKVFNHFLDEDSSMKIDDELNLKSLKQLHIINNNLTVLRKNYLSNLVGLRDLNLTDDNIQTIDMNAFQDTRNLNNLTLKRNKLTHIEKKIFEGLKELRFLDLSENRIEYLANDSFVLQENLIKLDLSNNLLKRIDKFMFNGLFRLKILDLTSNKLEHIPAQSFSIFKSLEELNLARNLLESLNSQTLSGLSKLKHFRAYGNMLKKISKDSLDDLAEIITIDLSNNLYRFTYANKSCT